MSRLFGRVASVLVARDTPLRPLQVGSPLRIQFKVEKQPLTPPNTADISITNLSADRVERCRSSAPSSSCAPGTSTTARTFRSSSAARRARSTASARRRVDHEDPVRRRRDRLSVREREPRSAGHVGRGRRARWRDALQEAASTSPPSSRSSGHAIAFPVPQFVFGFATQGNALQELDKLIAPRGYLVSIQSGELRSSPRTGPRRKKRSSFAGRERDFASPEHGSPDRNGLPSVLKVRSLLLAQLEPGDPFILKSADLNGSFRAEKVSHTGDTHGGEWTTEIEARAPVR
jgi:hypothetical protein